MAPSAEQTMPATRRYRKSIGGKLPSSKPTDKENATVDLGATLAANRKKSRSKSMGPGGLDVLQNGSGNRRASLAAISRPAPRSILKPTMAPLPEIPPLKKRGKAQPKEQDPPPVESGDGSSETKIALRTEEEQQAATKEREERERREARRKSLANRRVSFAAEATLHTFHEIEYMEDSTTSTDSTRRASAANGAPSPASTGRRRSSNKAASDQEEADELIVESPEKQNGTQQKSRRRSSIVAPPAFQQADNSMASSMYSSDSEMADEVEEVAEEEVNSDSSDPDSNDGTMITVEDHEVTGASVMSAFSNRSMGEFDENNTLDEALRTATHRAGTQRLDDSDEEAEVIPSFGWIKKNHQKTPMTEQQENASEPVENEPTSYDGMSMDMDMDLDAIPSTSVSAPRKPTERDNVGEQDMSMDVTAALGGILSTRTECANYEPSPSESGETMQFDQTMELTKAIGVIQKPNFTANIDGFDENEDMSMELTAAVGGFLSAHANKPAPASLGQEKTATGQSMDDATMDMDMTVGVGGILRGQTGDAGNDEMTMGMDMTVGLGGIIRPNVVDAATTEEDATSAMDMTSAVGAILAASPSREPRTGVSKPTEKDVDRPCTPSKSRTHLFRASGKAEASKTPEQNPFQGRGLKRSIGPQQAPSTPQSSPVRAIEGATAAGQTRNGAASPRRRPASPSKAVSSPVRTPKSQTKFPAGRSKLPDGRPTRTSPSKSTPKANDVFQHHPTTGARTPSVVLTPQRRRLSGVGADQSGLGSPRVTALLDRRESIGETALSFVPGKERVVSFANPRVMAEEVDRERLKEEEERETTLTLKDMIDSLSPQRNPLRSRKSLHIGSAKGLLGKRPAELDDEDDWEDRDGVKRLKGHQGSPVKNVRLQQPPSKAETTGSRPMLSSSLRQGTIDVGNGEDLISFDATSPQKPAAGEVAANSTPKKGHARFRSMAGDTATVDLHSSPFRSEYHAQGGDGNSEERIHLHDFLNMTSIRFMELTTTKRRHTQAPDAFRDGLKEGEGTFPLQRCVVAGACTVPMLELYQHSCRELKKYISEGRRIVREIETETFEENPPLFREYMTAAPDFKSLLDNQFKNGKSHARLESKAMWYEWRMALQEGLKEGLVRMAEGMTEDDKLLKQQQKLLTSVVPDLESRYAALDEERRNLEAVAEELDSCDTAELEAVREELNRADARAEEKAGRIAALRGDLEKADEDVKRLSTLKRECLGDITEAEKIREECRGWTATEINALQAQVKAIEKAHGWAITGLTGTTISMTYRRDIELVFDIASFQGRDHPAATQIDLWYIGSDMNKKNAETDFFVQCIRDQVRMLPQSRMHVSDLLHMVRAGWDLATSTCDDIRRVNITFPTNTARTSDSSVVIKSSLLLREMETKVEVELGLRGVTGAEGVEFIIQPEARVVYGEHFNVGKIQEFLTTRLGEKVMPKVSGGSTGSPSWSDVLVDLHEKLVARGRK